MSQIAIRWMIRRDVPRVLEIEQQCAIDPWNEDNLIEHLRHRNIIGMVAESCNKGTNILGFMVYELGKKTLLVHRITVAKESQRTGVGSAMVEKLTSKLCVLRRSRIIVDVPQANLESQVFFRKRDFKAISVNNDNDTYRMCYTVPKPCMPEQAKKTIS